MIQQSWPSCYHFIVLALPSSIWGFHLYFSSFWVICLCRLDHLWSAAASLSATPSIWSICLSRSQHSSTPSRISQPWLPSSPCGFSFRAQAWCALGYRLLISRWSFRILLVALLLLSFWWPWLSWPCELAPLSCFAISDSLIPPKCHQHQSLDHGLSPTHWAAHFILLSS